MTIAELLRRGKALLGRIPADALVLLALILASTLSFGAGILVGKDLEREKAGNGFWIEQLPEGTLGPAAAIEALPRKEEATVGSASGTYVASKNGTKYYLPSCGSSKRIKEENKVWFKTKEEAEAAGYGPAANCPGL